MSTSLRKQGGKIRKASKISEEEPGSKRSKKGSMQMEGESGMKKRHRNKELHYGPIVTELRSMDRKLRSQDKKVKEEEPEHKKPRKTNHKRKRATHKEEEEEELEIEIVETKRMRGKDYALVHFLGYPTEDNEWKPLAEIHSEETDSERPSEKEGKRKRGRPPKEEKEQVKRPKGRASKGRKKAEEEEERPVRPGRKKSAGKKQGKTKESDISNE